MFDDPPTRPPLMPTSAAIESRLAAIAIEKRELISLLKTVKRIESRRSVPLPLFPDAGADEPAEPDDLKGEESR